MRRRTIAVPTAPPRTRFPHARETNGEIGERLFISATTVKSHVTHILQKLGLRNRVEAVILAYESGLAQRDAGPGAGDRG